MRSDATLETIVVNIGQDLAELAKDEVALAKLEVGNRVSEASISCAKQRREVEYDQRENQEAHALDAAHACDKTEARPIGEATALVCAGDRDE